MAVARGASVFTPLKPLYFWLAAACAALAAAWSAAATSRPVLPSLVLGLALSALAMIDLASLRLPDLLTLPLAMAGMVLAFVTGDDPATHALGFAIGLASFWIIDFAYLRFRGRHGLGFGDAKLFGAAGAWLGAIALPQVLTTACAAGLAWIALRVLVSGRQSLTQPMPFGTALAIAIWAAWWMG